MHVLEAPHLQRARDEHHAGAMKRSVDNAKVFLTADDIRVNGNALHFLQINIIYILADGDNQVFVSFKLNVSGRCNFVHLVDNAFIMRRQHLRAIIPISLVAVIFLRIVGSCQDNAALATQMTDGK